MPADAGAQAPGASGRAGQGNPEALVLAVPEFPATDGLQADFGQDPLGRHLVDMGESEQVGQGGVLPYQSHWQ